MAANLFTFPFTHETTGCLDAVIGSEEVRVTYQYAPTDPPESARVEVLTVEIEIAPFDGKHWRPANGDEFEMYSDYAEDDLLGDLIDNAERDAEIALLRHALEKIAALEPDWAHGVDHNMEQIQRIDRAVLTGDDK